MSLAGYKTEMELCKILTCRGTRERATGLLYIFYFQPPGDLIKFLNKFTERYSKRS